MFKPIKQPFELEHMIIKAFIIFKFREFKAAKISSKGWDHVELLEGRVHVACTAHILQSSIFVASSLDI